MASKMPASWLDVRVQMENVSWIKPSLDIDQRLVFRGPVSSANTIRVVFGHEINVATAVWCVTHQVGPVRSHPLAVGVVLFMRLTYGRNVDNITLPGTASAERACRFRNVSVRTAEN